MSVEAEAPLVPEFVELDMLNTHPSMKHFMRIVDHLTMLGVLVVLVCCRFIPIYIYKCVAIHFLAFLIRLSRLGCRHASVDVIFAD